jgi:predicted HTH domain antitoxin
MRRNRRLLLPGRQEPAHDRGETGSSMTTVTLQFPDDVFSALRRSPEKFARELRVAAAIHWYERGELSQEKAAHVAGLSRAQFLMELARTESDAFVVDFEDLKRELSLG